MSDERINYAALSSEERRAMIGPLWRDGKSASEIADMFIGASRNSIIGVVNRAKELKAAPRKVRARPSALGPRKVNTGHKPKVAHKPKPIKNRRTVIANPAVPEMEHIASSELINNERPPLDGLTPINLLDLPNREGVRCRFPVQGGYCGADCGDRMYCDDHHQVMYRRLDK